MVKVLLRSAGVTVGTLFGGLVVGLLVGDLVFKLIPGSDVNNVQIGHAAIAALPALAGFLAGGAAWGVRMGRLAGSTERRRLAWSGLLGFAPITIVLAVGLGVAEPFIVEQMAHLPIHRVFTLLFVPSAFLIAGLSAFALGIGLRDRALARALLWQVGLTAALTFLVINMLFESQGWIVGAPRAAERATMVVVMSTGNLGAALAGGAMLGRLLAIHAGVATTATPMAPRVS